MERDQSNSVCQALDLSVVAKQHIRVMMVLPLFLYILIKKNIKKSFVVMWCDGSSDRSFMVDPLSYFSFQPVFHDWCNKGHGICYPVCGMVHIKEPLLLIDKSSLCGGSGSPLSLSGWSFTI